MTMDGHDERLAVACPQCGTPHESGGFCATCGHRFEAADTTAPEPAAPVVEAAPPAPAPLTVEYDTVAEPAAAAPGPDLAVAAEPLTQATPVAPFVASGLQPVSAPAKPGRGKAIALGVLGVAAIVGIVVLVMALLGAKGDLSDTKDDLAKTEQQLAETKQDLAKANDTVESTTDDLDDMTAKNTRLESTVSGLKDDLEEAKTSGSATQTTLDDYRACINGFLDAIDLAVSDDIDGADAKIAEVEPACTRADPSLFNRFLF